MKWTVIRLELASNWAFPNGSASRSYLLRLPLTDAGTIDRAALELHPARATVRRYWPNEADMVGQLVHTLEGYAIRYESKRSEANKSQHVEIRDLPLINFGSEAVHVGGEIMLTEPDGREARFRIADMQ